MPVWWRDKVDWLFSEIDASEENCRKFIDDLKRENVLDTKGGLDIWGMTPFAYAVHQQVFPLVNMFLDEKNLRWDGNINNNGKDDAMRIPLMNMIICNAKEEIILKLLSKPSLNVHIIDHSKKNAWHYAVEYKRSPAIIQRLEELIPEDERQPVLSSDDEDSESEKEQNLNMQQGNTGSKCAYDTESDSEEESPESPRKRARVDKV